MTSQTRAYAKKSSYHHGNLRATLLKAAELELSERGVEAFSLRSVAKRAGVSHAAPTHHFGDVTGVLTQLAVVGYRRFIATQKQCQSQASADPVSQLVASGLGYIEFATLHPALFRLLFTSNRPDRRVPELAACADEAFDKLAAEVAQLPGRDSTQDSVAVEDVMAAWAIAHGIAELMIGKRFERIELFSQLGPKQRERTFSALIRRAVIGPTEAP